MKKILSIIVTLLAVFSLNVGPVLAHTVVKPSTAGVGAFTDFSLGVQSEKPVATTKVQLMIPAGLNFVSPIVKPGWRIDVKSVPDPNGKLDDDGNPAQIVSEMDWSGGLVPAGQKDFFQFSAQVPSQATELDWKVVQSYSDSSTVSWTLGPNDAQPKDSKGNADFSKSGPFSKTMVVNDLKPSGNPAAAAIPTGSTGSGSNSAMALAIVALALSVIALGMQFRKSKV